LLLFSPAGASLPMTRVILILVAVFLILTVIRMVLSSRRR
jgi:preprotein translocase subunit SecG